MAMAMAMVEVLTEAERWELWLLLAKYADVKCEVTCSKGLCRNIYGMTRRMVEYVVDDPRPVEWEWLSLPCGHSWGQWVPVYETVTFEDTGSHGKRGWYLGVLSEAS